MGVEKRRGEGGGGGIERKIPIFGLCLSPLLVGCVGLLGRFFCLSGTHSGTFCLVLRSCHSDMATRLRTLVISWPP